MVDAFDTTGDNTQKNNCESVFLSYLGSAFHEFWERCGHAPVHPDDKALLSLEKARGRHKKPAAFELEFRPCPFDGPLETARLVICLANPKYTGLQGDINQLILAQREGTAPLPQEWDDWYAPRIAKRLKLSMNAVRHLVSVLNVCPYASPNMDGAETSHAAGLPSVWAAQKHVREVLIPRALQGEIHLVFLRKHELWGITEGWESNHIHVVRGRELDGMIPDTLATELGRWLMRKGHIVELHPIVSH